MVPFRYRPLGNNVSAIRLVKLNGVDAHGYLDMSLSDSVIKEDGFMALSYVWGTEVASYKVKLNGYPFWIRPNLFSFFTTCYGTIRGVDFWIDAVCIDQSNLEEKNRQVSLMGKIFSGASKVYAYLHEPASSSLLERNRTWVDGVVAGNPVSDPEISASNMIRLSQHTYWTRLWVVQELILARDVDILWCGQAINITKLASELSMITDEDKPPFQALSMIDENAVRSVQSLSTRIGSLARGTQFKAQQNLFELVHTYRQLAGTLSHDHVYSLLSLAKDGAGFFVDYAETGTSLFTRLIRTRRVLPDERTLVNVAKILDVSWTDFELLGLQRIEAKSQQTPTLFTKTLNGPHSIDVCSKCISFSSADDIIMVAGIPSAGLYFCATGLVETRFKHGGKQSRLALAFVVVPQPADQRPQILHRDSRLLLTSASLSDFDFFIDMTEQKLTISMSTEQCVRFLSLPQRLEALRVCQKFDRDTNRVGASCFADFVSQAFNLSSQRDLQHAINSGLPVPRLVKKRNKMGVFEYFLIENCRPTTWAMLRKL